MMGTFWDIVGDICRGHLEITGNTCTLDKKIVNSPKGKVKGKYQNFWPKESLSSPEAYMKFLVRERERARSDGKS
jgi:hypothetical protein